MHNQKQNEATLCCASYDHRSLSDLPDICIVPPYRPTFLFQASRVRPVKKKTKPPANIAEHKPRHSHVAVQSFRNSSRGETVDLNSLITISLITEKVMKVRVP